MSTLRTPRYATLMQARRPLNAMLRTRLVDSLVTPHSVDDYLKLVDPAWSVRQVQARVVGVRPEADDAVSLRLVPNENWHGFVPGQFVQLSVWIDGIRYTRCFSISSAPGDGMPVRVTIKTLPGGRVSTWASREACPGDVVELSQASGEFVLPDPVPPRLLFVTGGSGITPVVAMARHLAASGYAGTIRWLHYARNEVILGDELGQLARRKPALHPRVYLTRSETSGAPSPRFSQDELDTQVPDWRTYETFACGPDPLLHAVTSVWEQEGLAEHLHVEKFTAAMPSRKPDDTEAAHRLLFAKSQKETRGNEGASLLEQAEAAGLTPPSGCRMGICHTCKCVKRSGVVRNEVTGIVDDEPDKPIQLCIHTAQSDVALDL